MEVNPGNDSGHGLMINKTEDADVLFVVAVVRVVIWVFLGVPTALFNCLILRGLVLAKELPRPCRSLLVNMACSDMLSGITIIVNGILFLDYDSSRWYDCVGATAVQSVLALVSVFLSTLFPVNAYLSQLIPFKYRGTMSPIKIVIASAIVWSVPIVIVIMSLKGTKDDVLNCSPIFVFSRLDLRWFSGIYFLCMLVMSCVYLKLYCLARGHISKIVSQTHHAQRSTINVSLQKRALKTVSLVAASFVLMYTPLALFMLVAPIQPPSDLLPQKVIFEYSLLTLFLAKSIVNPIVYSWKIPFVREVTHNLFKSSIGKNSQTMTTTAVTSLEKTKHLQNSLA